MTRSIRFLAAACAACAFTVGAFASENTVPDRVVLVNGDVLLGHVVTQTDESVTLLHDVLGEVSLPRKNVLEVSLAPALSTILAQSSQAQQAAALAAASAISLKQPASPDVDAPAEPEEPKVKWESKIELGANGQQGNSDSTALYAAFSTKRTDDISTFLVEANYRLANEDGDNTSNRFFARERFERRLLKHESRWSAFVQATQEYDQFKDYDFRWTLTVGPQYDIVRNDTTLWNAYLGFGVAQEIGGVDDDINPILLLGTYVEHKFNERVSISARGEYEPVIDDFSNYVLRGNAALTVALNEAKSLNLSIGVADEYQSEPGSAKNNDFYYYAALVYAF